MQEDALEDYGMPLYSFDRVFWLRKIPALRDSYGYRHVDNI